MEKDWLDSVQIKGIIFEKSDFGEMSRGSFEDEYAGGKRVKLSGRPSIKWIKIFESIKRTRRDDSPWYHFGVILLQPNLHEIIFTCENVWTKTALRKLNELVEWVNQKCLEEEVLPTEVLHNLKDNEYIEMSRKYFEFEAS